MLVRVQNKKAKHKTHRLVPFFCRQRIFGRSISGTRCRHFGVGDNGAECRSLELVFALVWLSPLKVNSDLTWN
jgi:hypothetical protein